jgi:hypothetical protein
MNVEIGAEAAQFPEKEYINGIAVAVPFKIKLTWMEVHKSVRLHCEGGLCNIRNFVFASRL